MSSFDLQRARALAKAAISKSGLSPLYRLEIVSGLFKFGCWLKNQQADRIPYLPSRFALYEFINGSALNSCPIDYLEFGVYRGESMRAWLQTNRHPNSRFFGFDTFEGLPESWATFTNTLSKGTFSTGGQIPLMEDNRVTFVKGLFQHVVPGFLATFRPLNRLVVHLDADLYTSTLYVLTVLHPLMVRATIIIFDEFSCVASEFRAFSDYAESFCRKYHLLGASGSFYDQVAIELTS